jgi:integrase
MAYIRQFPSGLWAATVRTPVGRITETRELKGAVQTWAENLEADINRGDFMDPRLANHTVGEVWEKFGGARKLEKASRKRDASTWKNWVAPRWAKVPVGSILKPDVQAWVNELDGELGPKKAWTVIAALNVLKATLELAVDAGWVRTNPARKVKPPEPPRHVDRVIEPEEEVQLLARLDELFPDRRDARPFVEFLLDTGVRWEEAAAVRREAVNLRAGLVVIGPVMERDGTIREYPKGKEEWHPVPLGDDLLARLRPLVLATAAGGLVFTASLGGPMRYPTWLRRVWKPAVEPLAEPRPTPHDCRHTYGTRLADAGIPVHDRMALMGHKDMRSGQRYTHSGDKRFDAAREALKRARSGS